MEGRRANYALVPVQQHLGQTSETLAVPWAEFVGDATDEFEFTLPTDSPTEASLELQAYDVEAYGHEIRSTASLSPGSTSRRSRGDNTGKTLSPELRSRGDEHAHGRTRH